MEGHQRDVLPDVLKGFGAFLVVLGHCIQSGSGLAFLESAGYFEDKVYQFIYSFHMPLFMVISGYYAWNSVSRAKTGEEQKAMLVKKCIYLITPSVAWKLIEFVYLFAADAYIYWGFGVFLKDLIVGILTDLWFLWSVLYAFVLVCLMHYRFRDSVWVYILIFMTMFFTPDGMALNAFKYVLPYYLIGFYVNKNKNRLLSTRFWQGLQNGPAVLVSGMAFFVLFSFYTADSFIYLTGYKLIGKDYLVQLGIDVYRFLVGLSGIVFCFFVWRALLGLRCRWERGVRVLSYLGRRGFGIYIISGMLVLHVVCPITADWEPRYVVNLIETVLVLLASLVIVEGLRRIPWACRLVGERQAGGR